MDRPDGYRSEFSHPYTGAYADTRAETELKTSSQNTHKYAPAKMLAIAPGRKPRYVERFNIEHYLLDGRESLDGLMGKSRPSCLSRMSAGTGLFFVFSKMATGALADKVIPSLDNPILMGHVLAQRYLHPTKYRSSYDELRAWMVSYADHPDARRLYKLALNRRPANWKLPKAPAGRSLNGSGHDGRKISYRVYNPRKKLNRVERREMLDYERRLRFYLRKGWTLAFKRLINDQRVKKIFHSVQMDKERANLAAGYFAAGRDDWALKAEKAAQRSGKYLPEAHWTAALASWRLGQFKILVPISMPWLGPNMLRLGLCQRAHFGQRARVLKSENLSTLAGT